MLYFKLEAEGKCLGISCAAGWFMHFKQCFLLTNSPVEDGQGAIRESHQDSTFDMPVKKKQTSGGKKKSPKHQKHSNVR